MMFANIDFSCIRIVGLNLKIFQTVHNQLFVIVASKFENNRSIHFGIVAV